MKYSYSNHQFDIYLPKSKEFNIYLFGDIHRDTSSCDVEKWKQFLKETSKDPNGYYLGMGDYHDFASSSERKKIRNSDLHETTSELFDNIVQRKNRELAKECQHMRGRLIGLIEGNHNWSFEDGTSSTTDLASRLNSTNLGWLSHITLHIHDTHRHNANNTSKKAAMFTISACHGVGSGRTMGATINSVDKLHSIFPASDLFCMGHDHQLAARPNVALIPHYNNFNNTCTIKEHTQWLCRTGSFKKAYNEGRSSYEVGGLYRPSYLGWLTIKVKVVRKVSIKNKIDNYIVTTKVLL